MTSGVKGRLEAGKKFLDRLNMFKRLVNMGDAKSLATHPASTTHRHLTSAQQAGAGAKPKSVRLHIAIELSMISSKIEIKHWNSHVSQPYDD